MDFYDQMFGNKNSFENIRNAVNKSARIRLERYHEQGKLVRKRAKSIRDVKNTSISSLSIHLPSKKKVEH